MSSEPIGEQLRGAAAHWTPAEDLRARVLGAAAPLVRPATTWSDRVWFSRGWRLAAAALVVGVLALDALSPSPGRAAGAEPASAAKQTAQAVDEAARQAGFGPEQAKLFARRALVAANAPDRDADQRVAAGFPQTGDTR